MVVKILFTMDDTGYFHRRLLCNGIGLWVLSIFYQYLKRHKKTVAFEHTSNKDGYDYVLYLRSIRRVNINKLLSFIFSNNINAIIPSDVGDATFLAVHSSLLQRYVALLVCRDFKIYDRLDNKKKLLKLTDKLDINTPKTLKGKNLHQLPQFLTVTKFPYYWKQVANTNGGSGVVKIINFDGLSGLRRTGNLDNYILQEGVSGIMYSVDCLFSVGKLIAVFGKKRISAGYKTSIRKYFFPSNNDQHTCAEPQVLWRLIPLIRKIGLETNYSGLTDIEFMVNGDQYWLIEINPRFSGGCYSWIGSEFLGCYLDVLFGKSVNTGLIESSTEKFSSLTSQNILGFYANRPKILKNLNKWVK